MIAQHTPGPWTFSDGILMRVNVGGKGICVAGVHRIGKARDCYQAEAVGRANGRLIAAAPMLLEAAQDTVKALNLLRTGLIERAPETIEMIDAHIDELWTAIAKAKGEAL